MPLYDPVDGFADADLKVGFADSSGRNSSGHNFPCESRKEAMRALEGWPCRGEEWHLDLFLVAECLYDSLRGRRGEVFGLLRRSNSEMRPLAKVAVVN